jgi:hypothetical protein
MQTPNSSSKGKTTTQPGSKIITREMYKRLTPAQRIELRDQGWQDENPISPDWKTEWQKQADAQGFTYKAPNFNPSKHLISPDGGDTYVAGMQNLPNEQLQQLRADPDMQQIASSMGVGVDDLLLYRQMMLDRYANRYQNISPPEQDTEQ